MKRIILVLTLTLVTVLLPLTAEASRFQIGPVSGITTAWHPAPETIAVPLGTTLTFKRDMPDGATVAWTGALETTGDQGWTVAECYLGDPGRHVVGVEVEFPGGGRIEEKTTIDVLAIDPAQISISPIRVSVDPVELDEDDLNASTYEYFLGHSIAALRQVAPNRYRTSTDRPVKLSVEVEPPAFASLTEWRTPGRLARLGTSRTVTYHHPARGWIYAGPTANQRAVFLETYKVEITSHVSNRDIVPMNAPVTFSAVTIPPGFEDEITWLASTKYGASDPTMGIGPQFTVWFEDTWGPHSVFSEPFRWLGVKADNAAFNHDQKADQCAVPMDQFPLEGSLLSRVQDSSLTQSYEASLNELGLFLDYDAATEQAVFFNESPGVPADARHAVVPAVDIEGNLMGLYVHSSTSGIEGADFVRLFSSDIDPDQRTVRTFINPALCEWVDVVVAEDESTSVSHIDNCAPGPVVETAQKSDYGTCLGIGIAAVVGGAEGLGLGTACRALCATCAIPPHASCVGCAACAIGYIGCAIGIWWAC